MRAPRLLPPNRRFDIPTRNAAASCSRTVSTSFCIVTTTPNELCASVHGRMPLILREEDFAAWLDVTAQHQAVDALLRPYAAAKMECYPVSTAVNNVRNETMECLEQVEEFSAQMRLAL